MCVLGKRLLKDIDIGNCTKDVDGILWQEYCRLQNNTNDRDYVRFPDVYRSKERNWDCDPYFASELESNFMSQSIWVDVTWFGEMCPGVGSGNVSNDSWIRGSDDRI